MDELDSLLSHHFGAYAISGAPHYSSADMTEEISGDPAYAPTPAPGLALAHESDTKANPRSRCGRKPFGHFAGEAEVIQRIMELRAQGLGFDRLAEKLNEESVRSRSGKIWHGRVVNRIVKSQLEK